MLQYELNLRDYLRIFRKRRLIILATFFIVTIASSFLFLNQPVEYQASATIKIEERKTIAGLLTEWIVYNPGDVMESETKVIKGYPVMKEVALKLGKISEQSSLEEVNNVVNGLQGEVETERIGSTNMIRIVVKSDRAKDAMDLANTVAQVYTEENLKEKAKQARHAREFIEEQLSSLEERLKNTEEQLRTFGEGVQNIRLAEPIQQKLVELEFQLAEMLQKYTEKHPKVMQLENQIREMESQINGFSGQELEYARLNREVDVNKKLYAMLKEKLEEARITEAQKVSDVSVVNPAVLPAAPLAGNKMAKLFIGGFLGFILGISLAFVTETMDTSIGTIEDVENVIKLPVLGVIPSFEKDENRGNDLLESVKNVIWPKYRTETDEKLVRLMAHYQPRSPITEAYRNIHTNLKLDASRKTIMITSSNPQEGKSSVACNLGLVIAQVGLKILLVSTDLRRPIISKTFGIKKEPGLNELVRGTVKLEETLNNITDIMLGEMSFEDLRKTPGIENIWILSSGALPANPVELLESKAIETLIQTLRQQFDVIIFDTPPVLPVTDASILAPKIDCTVIVYEIGRTGREALMRTKVQLESAGAKIAGVVLNHTRPQTEEIANYPYHHYKYKYYGSKEDEKKRKG